MTEQKLYTHTHTHAHVRAHTHPPHTPPFVAGGNLAALIKHSSESDRTVRASMAPWKHRDANICYCHSLGGVCVNEVPLKSLRAAKVSPV